MSAIVLLLVTLAAGLAGGVVLTSSLLDAAHVPGALRYGSWALWPRAGTMDADPYTRALFARRGELAMAPAEGVALYALRDDEGRVLTGACGYVIEGVIPAARVWSLTAYNPDGTVPDNAARRTGLTSADLVGGSDRAEITISAQPSSGNWLPMGMTGRFMLMLRLYDTPLTAVTAALDTARLPRIRRLECQS